MTEPRSINCEEALKLLAALIDHELEPVDQIPVERHLETCRSCFSRAEFERALKQQLAHIGRHDVDTTFEDRIRTLIGRFASESDPRRSAHE